MNEIIHSLDLAKKISNRDLMVSMSLLGVLPSRTSESPETLLASYWISLEGISKFALEGAVREILRGALNHTYFPTPVEIRQEVAKIENPIRDAQHRKAAEIAQAEDEARIRQAHAQITPGTRARVAAIHAGFTAKYEADRARSEALYGTDQFSESNRRFDAQRNIYSAETGSLRIDPDDPRLADIPDLSVPYFKNLKTEAA